MALWSTPSKLGYSALLTRVIAADPDRSAVLVSMTTDKRKGGRITPKGTPPPHLRSVGGLAHDRSPVDDIIDSAARELLEESDPVAAEIWASGIVDAFARATLQAQLNGLEAPPFEDALLDRCRQRRDQHAGIVAVALAAVLPPPLGRRAASILGEPGRSAVGLPTWAATVGRTEPTRGWVVSAHCLTSRPAVSAIQFSSPPLTASAPS